MNLPAENGRPLQIEYSSTRVIPEAGRALLRVPGVMRPDRSVLAETFKMLRNQVTMRLRAGNHRLLAVTSPRAMQGKSLTAVNLALAMAADFDTAVMLVDGDLRGRGLQRWFGLGDDAPGLGDHLSAGVPIPELLVNPGFERFVFLPAGSRPRDDSAELLATRAAGQLIQSMKLRYADRIIVVDLPSLLDSADALAFLPQIDTSLLVVEDHGSSLADVEAAAELLAPFELLGTVMAPRPEPAIEPSPGRRWFGRRQDTRST